MKEVYKDGSHIITLVEGRRVYGQRRGELSCSCRKYKSTTFSLTYRGEVPKFYLKQAIEHIHPFKGFLAPEHEMPVLIGEIEKKRVKPHQVWIFHLTHDTPKINTSSHWRSSWFNERAWETEMNHWSRRTPHVVLLKHSTGWRMIGLKPTWAEALAVAHKHLENNFGTIVVQAPLNVGVEAFPTSVKTAVANLIKEHRGLTYAKPEAYMIEEYRKVIAELDKALDTIYTVQELRNRYSQMLREAMGLDLLETIPSEAAHRPDGEELGP